MAAYEPGFEPTDSLECCLEKIKGKFFILMMRKAHLRPWYYGTLRK